MANGFPLFAILDGIIFFFFGLLPPTGKLISSVRAHQPEPFFPERGKKVLECLYHPTLDMVKMRGERSYKPHSLPTPLLLPLYIGGGG